MAQDDQPIGHRVDVIDVVGNENHREAPPADLLHIPQHLTGLFDREGGGGFVEDQQAHTEVKGTADGDRLAFPAGEHGDRLPHRSHPDADLLQHAAGHLFHLPHIEERNGANPPHRFPAQEEIPGDAHHLHQCQILIDRLDAQGPGFPGRAETNRPPLEIDLACVRWVDPGKDLDQGGFAGPVIPQEAHHLLIAHREIHPGQGLYPIESLDDPPHLHQPAPFAHRRSPILRSQKENGHLRALLRTGKALFVVGHERSEVPVTGVRKKRTGTYVPYYEREKSLLVVGHGAKRSARLSVHKKTTGTYVPYYEPEKPRLESGTKRSAHHKCSPIGAHPDRRIRRLMITAPTSTSPMKARYQ